MSTIVSFPDLLAETPARQKTQIRRIFLRRVASSLRNEIHILTAAALIGYLASALWVRFGLHFWINDALNRTDDALYVTVGRDPHLGAIGFYWPPLPQLIQIPIMPIVRPFGEEILAGPISSAICMAATIPVLAAIGRKLGRNRWTIFAVCTTFAAVPYIMYTASNGMSEACFYLALAITMLGFFGYIESGSTQDLLILAFGLAAVTMTRPEGPVIVIAVVAVATLKLRRLRASAWQALLAAIPAFGVYAFWLIVQYVLLGDPIFYIHQNTAQATTAQSISATWLPSHIYGHPLRVLWWIAGWVFTFSPLLLVIPLLLLVPRYRPIRGSFGILAAMGAVLAVQFVSVGYQHGYGDPRYFGIGLLLDAIAIFWVGSDRLKRAGHLLNAGLIATLIFTAGFSSYSLTSGRVTHVEGECAYFQYGVARVIPFLGRPQAGRYACERFNGLEPWEHADHWIDSHLSPRDRILDDNGSNFAATLFTTRPDLFVVPNDRDWQRITADPRHITYIITQSLTPTSPPSTAASLTFDEGAALLRFDPVGWHLVQHYAGGLNVLHQKTYVQIWHFIPHPGAPTPTGPESNLR
jgi:dolichyl-phosphate-mannose-protein mannosyltransferase